jgi:hypothetical protein
MMIRVLLVALLLAGCARGDRERTNGAGRFSPADSSAAAAVVTQFGERLQRVSLLAPDSLVRASIRSEYAEFVSASLLEEWLRDPASAPGRETSSPWPDRIRILSGARDPANDGMARFAFLGEIVEETSSGTAPSVVPVRATVSRQENGWRITRFTQGRREVPRGSDPSDDRGGSDAGEDAPERAAGVIRSYYRAIAEERYREAYDAWGSDGRASGQSFDEFRNGFSFTAEVEASVGPPGRVEGAAGSRYVEVPVRVTARQDDGTRISYAGTYTLRRSVVEGATPRQRTWHIASADIRRTN